MSKGNEEFEIVDPSTIEFVKRGRKASLNPNLIQALKALSKGQTIALKGLQQNPDSETYKNDKSRISSQIRSACESAGHKKYRINWTAQGIPCVTV
jgi:hypothetical protein